MPGQTSQTLSADELRQMSMPLVEALGAESLDEGALGALKVATAMPGDVLASIAPGGEDGGGVEPYPALGEFVKRNAEEIWAERYGYVCLAANRLSIVPPVWMDGQGLRAYWCVLGDSPRAPEPEAVIRWLEALGVSEGIDPEAVGSVAGQVGGGNLASRANLVAQGVDPVPGTDAELEVLVATGPPAGVKLPDGSTDFSETELKPGVEAGSLVARITRGTEGTPGRNLRGQVCPARKGRPVELRAGKGVETRESPQALEFYATSQGTVKQVDGEISVSKVLVVPGNVDFTTGNLEFAGDVYVVGSVGPNFSVEASGDVVVAKAVEAGVTLSSQGSVTVGQGIIGRKTKVIALGDVWARCVENASVQSAGKITLGSHAQQAFLRGVEIHALKAPAPKGGSIAGGQAWALKEVDARTLGYAIGVATTVVVGTDLATAQKLDELDDKLSEGTKQILRLLGRFGIERVDVTQIQSLLTASTGTRRRMLALAARQLGKLVQVHQGLLRERQRLEEWAVRGAGDAHIRVRETAYPGVTIRVGTHRKEIDAETASPDYHVAGGHLMEA